MISFQKRAMLACVLMTVSTQVFAQDAQQTYAPSANQSAYDNFDVLSRPRPEYESAGVKMGAFTARPSVELKGLSNDNIRATDTQKDADMIAVISPELNVKSNFNRHELSFKAASEIGRFHQRTQENYENFQGNVDGRIDVLNDLNITAGAAYGSLYESRMSSLAPVVTDSPVQYDKMGGYLGLNKTFNRLEMQTSVDYTRYDYDDGSVGGLNLNQDDRDVDVINYNGRTNYEFSPGYKAFVKGTISDREYFNADSGVNPSRDSLGYRGTAGVSAELTNLVVGEIDAGYAYRDYDNFKNVGTFVYGAAINWYPTPLLTARFSADKDIVDGATINAGTTVSGIEQTRYGTELNYEVLRNFIITPEVAYTEGDYQGSGDEEYTYMAGIKGDYYLNRNVALEAGYEFTNRNSTISVLEYDRNLFMVGIKAKL